MVEWIGQRGTGPPLMGLFPAKCRWPTCSKTGRFAHGFCSDHEQHAPKRSFDKLKPGIRDKFYDTPEWRKTRKEYLEQHPWCQLRLKDCKRRATQVDHKKPRSEGGASLDPSNLQGLCSSCHGKKTLQQRRERRLQR